MISTIDDHAWRAIVSRDSRLDGAFVYGVTSTSVFCRPSCAARRPKRENVVIFPTVPAARRAGFRPCKRCRPDGGADRAGESLERARLHLETHRDRVVTLEELAGVAGLSAGHLQRAFTRTYGTSPRRYQQGLRFESFRRESRRRRSVLEGALAAGFGSSRGVYDGAKSELGMTPGAYRAGGRGEIVMYATAPTALGIVLVAQTRRGVCALLFGDEPAVLERQLARDLPRAELQRDDLALAPSLAAVQAFLDGQVPDVRVPLDLDGTEFQRRVWDALRRIPAGERRTYAEIAAAIDRPGASRAVGAACAANRVALAVPCHRVVRADGRPGGYRWGADRKRALVELEAGEPDGR